jgi:hypothetical protein
MNRYRAARKIPSRVRAKDSSVDSKDSITTFFFTDSIWGLRGARLKLCPRVARIGAPFAARLRRF